MGFNRGMPTFRLFRLVALAAFCCSAAPAFAVAPESPGQGAGQAAGQAAKPAAHGAPPIAAQARRKAIDDLFARLGRAPDGAAAAPIREVILRLWDRSGSPTADLLMARGESLLKSGNGPQSAALFDRIVTLYPDWTSAWRRRAQSALLQGDSEGAMLDLDHALSIEPRNFLAMTELATLMRAEGRDGPALELMRRALALDPQNDDLRAETEKLARKVEGDRI
ncbi:tetratricopeptide repeat protein [Rhodoblastus sp.]|uniref:tetratricopeptide repeat protein n=1 Tax=Rhodoblastus sp. TaxID=1962975 RepID=UPI0035AFEEDA